MQLSNRLATELFKLRFEKIFKSIKLNEFSKKCLGKNKGILIGNFIHDIIIDQKPTELRIGMLAKEPMENNVLDYFREISKKQRIKYTMYKKTIRIDGLELPIYIDNLFDENSDTSTFKYRDKSPYSKCLFDGDDVNIEEDCMNDFYNVVDRVDYNDQFIDKIPLLTTQMYDTIFLIFDSHTTSDGLNMGMF